MANPRTEPKISFLAFFLLWAERMNWQVPDIHLVACHWLEHRGPLAVMRCFRGFSKSTILAVYNAWLYYNWPTFRILHQGDQDGTAYKTSRDTKRVLQKHPLTRAWVAGAMRGDVAFWWVPEADDERNPSMQAAGILSNITSSRADECQNDDVEVPRNIATPEAREKLRYRLGEQTHILVPGGRKLFIGTPHTHDSLYDEIERMGADCLTIRMFEREHRIEEADGLAFHVPFRPDFVFAGIGAPARLLELGKDYHLTADFIEFTEPPGGLIDCYAGCAWPERFDAEELLKRRRETRTVNEWDSQYQLHSKPVTESRLDPDRLKPYDVQPRFETGNRQTRMLLGNAQIVSARAYWDCALGKIGGDASAFALVLDDAAGNYYWHVAEGFTGEFAEFADSRNTRIVGGQVMQCCDLIERFQIPQVIVEANNNGAFVPQLLRQAIKQRGLRCGVVAQTVTGNKNIRILEGLEPPIKSGVLWAHVDVLEGPLYDQMKQWNPAVKEQPDDYLDSGAGAILGAPVRVGKQIAGNQTSGQSHDWRPDAGVHEVALDY